MSYDFKGDFKGFTLDGIHSSTFNMVRTSEGDRFNSGLLPNQEDIVIPVPGRDGEVYIDRKFSARNFSISFAYDNMTEEDLRDMINWLYSAEEHELIFDENPYKAYKVKINGEPTVSYVPFDTQDPSVRIYKGEGQIVFTAYYPYATSTKRFLSDFDSKQQWAKASGMLKFREDNNFDKIVNSTVLLYNPGDIESPMKITFTPIKETGFQSFTLRRNGDLVYRIIIDLSYLTVGTRYTINGFNELIESGKTAHNRAKAAGEFIKVPVNRRTRQGQIIPQELNIDPAPGVNVQMTSDDIAYDYLYI